MGTLTKFKGDTLKASKDIVPYMFVWWGAQTYKLLQNSATLRGYILVSLQQIMFKLGIFTNFFKSSSAALTDFCLLVPVKKCNRRGRVYSN